MAANLFQAKAALAVFDRIEGKPEGLTTVTDAELALLNANQQLSGQMIAQKLADAAGDKARCEEWIAKACRLEPDALRAHAQRAVQLFAARQSPSLLQLAALLIQGRAEHELIAGEIARRETAARGGLN